MNLYFLLFLNPPTAPFSCPQSNPLKTLKFIASFSLIITTRAICSAFFCLCLYNNYSSLDRYWWISFLIWVKKQPVSNMCLICYILSESLNWGTYSCHCFVNPTFLSYSCFLYKSVQKLFDCSFWLIHTQFR